MLYKNLNSLILNTLLLPCPASCTVNLPTHLVRGHFHKGILNIIRILITFVTNLFHKPHVATLIFLPKELDGADDLLAAERQHLLKLKRILEAQLRSVQKQLQVLDGARKRLTASLQERSRVLDLVCHAVSSVRGAGIKDQVERPITPPVEPLGPYTPECARVISTAAEARQRSTNLRKEVAEAIEQTVKLQKAAHQSVNDGLTQKVAETVTMKVSYSVGWNVCVLHL